MPPPQLANSPCPKAAVPLHPHTLPSAAIQPTDHVDGRLRYASLFNGCTRILPTWLLTTSDRDVAAQVSKLLDGKPHVDDDWLEECYQVLTGYAELAVLLDGPQAVRLQMLRRYRTGVPHSCGCHPQQLPLGECRHHCPGSLKACREIAKTGRGCEPLVHITCRLAADPALGSFLFSSASWTFAEHAAEARTTLRGQQQPARACLRIERVLHTAASGTIFAHTRPAITILPGRLVA